MTQCAIRTALLCKRALRLTVYVGVRDAFRKFDWILLQPVRAAVSGRETVFTLGDAVVENLNVRLRRRQTCLAFLGDNHAAAVLREGGRLSDHRATLLLDLALVCTEQEVALAYVDARPGRSVLALLRLAQVVLRELPFVARLVVDFEPAKVVVGHPVARDAVFLR